jgi:hypothetical protein
VQEHARLREVIEERVASRGTAITSRAEGPCRATPVDGQILAVDTSQP